MLTNKTIAVVAPKQYLDLARKLSHEISKRADLNATVWTIKHYEDTECTFSGKQCAILLGNSEENKLTKDYLPIIGDKLENRAGACFGYGGSKALIFGGGKLNQADEFKNLLKEMQGYPVTAIILAYFAPFFSTTALYIYLVSKLASLPAKRRKLLRAQTEVALTLFLTEKFDQMFENKKVNLKDE